MKITNQEIYLIANNLATNFVEINTYIPVKVNFFMQKNIEKITAAAQDIEKARLDIAKHYGVLSEDGQRYEIPDDKTDAVAEEMKNLFSLEQDLDIKTFKIDDFGAAEFTPPQLSAIMFMIED